MISWIFQNNIYELKLSTEPCNEIGTETLRSLEEFLEQVDLKKAQALILYSSLPSGFCAGANLRELYERMQSKSKSEQTRELREFLDRIHVVMNKLDTLPLTTIGVIHGVCFGGGFELALTCDVLIAETTARFCFPELRLGIVPGFGGIPRLKREVGNAVVRDLLLTGRSINAEKAKTLGLVSQTANPNRGLEIARQMALQSTKFDLETLRTAKKFIKPIPHEELEKEKEHFLTLFQRPTIQKALQKFVESQDVRPYLP